jgi:hypothetical protein
MSRIVTIEQHAVFVTLDDGTQFRSTDWMDWSPAIDRWQAMDDQRREALGVKGVVVYRGQQVRHFEVRSEHDPRYASLPLRNLVTGFAVYSREYTTDIAAAKAVLKPLGYYAKAGGWVYQQGRHGEHTVTQGWFQAATLTGHPVVRLDGEKGYRAVVTTSLQVHCEIGA